jgi:hypothetical protein
MSFLNKSAKQHRISLNYKGSCIAILYYPESQDIDAIERRMANKGIEVVRYPCQFYDPDIYTPFNPLGF